MPVGVYPRTERHIAICRKGGQISSQLCTDKQTEARRNNARKMGKLPKTDKQRKASRKTGRQNVVIMNSLPKTQTQIDSARLSAKKLGKLPRTQKQLDALKLGCEVGKKLFNKESLVEHHIYLKKNSEDVVTMKRGVHCTLHRMAYDYIYYKYGKRGIDDYLKWFNNNREELKCR